MVNQIKHSQYIDLINLLEDLGASPERCQSFFSVALKLPDLQDLELDYAFDIIKSYALENGIDLKDYLFSNYMSYNDFYIRLYSRIEKEILKNYISHNSYLESKKIRL
ncbi:hypothetical protein RAC90_05250 [Pantoea sp. CS_6]|uniref:hypothetical protein n=1 Tax=Pantoea sp. CS_6 TaxID=3055795 RepID=UPI0035BEE575